MEAHQSPALTTATNFDGEFAGEFNTAFDTLLTAWNQHQSLRSQGAPAAQLFQSRASLDANRLSTARIATAS